MLITAMLCIFALLAIPFKSYFQPLIIMFCIPFGMIGAIAGHVIMGYSLSIMSLFGLVAMSGVVVYDSLQTSHAIVIMHIQHVLYNLMLLVLIQILSL